MQQKVNQEVVLFAKFKCKKIRKARALSKETYYPKGQFPIQNTSLHI